MKKLLIWASLALAMLLPELVIDRSLLGLRFPATAPADTIHFVVRKSNSPTVLYKVYAIRDPNVYPSANAFKTAATNGEVIRYTDEGCPIPIGTRAPVTKPTCGTVISVAYNQPFEAEAASGPGTTYDKGEASGGKIRDGELTYSVPSLPAPGSYTLALTYQSTTNPPTAQISVNNSPAQALTLQATEGSLQTATTTLAGFVSGNNTVKITPVGYFATDKIVISRVGSTTVTTPGSGTTTDPGSQTITPPSYLSYNYPTVASIATWPAYNSDPVAGVAIGEVHVLENAYVKVEIRSRFGGAIQIIDKTNGNRKVFSFTDHGRESEIGIYGGPDNFSAGVPGNWSGIGWNPLTVGDDGGHGSILVAYGVVRGNDNIDRVYVKYQLLNWPDGRVTSTKPLEAYAERWIALNGKEVDVKSRQRFDRSDLTFYEAKKQEYPCFMTAGVNSYNIYYNGNKPYTGASVTSTNTKESATGLSFNSGNQFTITEPWNAIDYDQGGHYVFLNSDKLALLGSNIDGLWDAGSSGENQYPVTYSSAGNFLTLDPKGTWYHDYAWYVTSSLSEGRAWANARPRKYGNVPNWAFDVAHGRNDWFIQKGTDQREPFTSNGWQTTWVPTSDNSPLTARRSAIVSPYVIHKASDIQTIYVQMSYDGPETAMLLKWRRNGQKEGSTDGVGAEELAARFPNGAWDEWGQSISFPIQNDGQKHTYAINVASSPQWKDVIQQYTIRHTLSGPDLPTEHLTLYYFGVNTPTN